MLELLSLRLKNSINVFMDEARNYIKKWKNHLNIKKYRIYLEEVKDRQIKCYTKDCELVGVVTNDHGENTATIYYSRPVLEEDIVHELLHLAHPRWTESQVRKETSRLKNQESEDNNS